MTTRLKLDDGTLSLGRLSFRLQTLQQGGWMLIAMVVTGFINYISNVFVGRRLGPADYSIFASMASLSLILAVVTGVVQTVVTHYVARLQSRGATIEVGGVLVYLLKRLFLWGIGGALMFSLVAKPLAAFLRLPSFWPVATMSLFLVPTAILPVVNGIQRGLQRFGALGWTQLSIAIFRLLAVVGLVSAGLGATGAVASLPLAGLGACAVGLYFLWDIIRLKKQKAAISLSSLFENSINTIVALMAFAILNNSDVLIVKSRFSPTEAGLYSATSILGTTTLWLSGAIVILLLPKAAELHARGQSAAGLVRQSLLAVGVLCGSITLAFFLFPSWIVETIFGKPYLATASLLGWYGLAMSFLSFVNVWLVYYIAIQERRYSYILLAGAVLQIVLLLILPLTLASVVYVLVGTEACLFLIGMAGLKQPARIGYETPSRGNDDHP